MYPVAGGTVRMPMKDVLLGGKYLIPKGTTVFLPVRPLSPCVEKLSHYQDFSHSYCLNGADKDSHIQSLPLCMFSIDCLVSKG